MAETGPKRSLLLILLLLHLLTESLKLLMRRELSGCVLLNWWILVLQHMLRVKLVRLLILLRLL